jgi:multidrug resistance protein MdtO
MATSGLASGSVVEGGRVTFLERELAPTPGRAVATLRIMCESVVLTIATMTLQHSEPALPLTAVFVLPRDNFIASVRTVMFRVLGPVAAGALAIIALNAFSADPVARFFLFFSFAFLGPWLSRTCVFPVGPLAGLTGAMCVFLWDGTVSPAVNLQNTIWTVGHFGLGGAAVIILETLFLWRDPTRMLIAGLAQRLRAVQAALFAYGSGAGSADRDKAWSHVSRLAVAGVFELRDLLSRAERSSVMQSMHFKLGDLIGRTERLLDLAATFDAAAPGKLDEVTASRARRLADVCGQMAADIERKKWPEPLPEFASDDSSPERSVLSEMERILTGPAGTPGSAKEHAENLASLAAAGHPYQTPFVADAFENSEYAKFALKTALAATICYILVEAYDVRQIFTAAVTCLLTASATQGASTQKQILRIAGAIIGGLMGISAVVFLLPYADSIGFLCVVVALGAAVAGWVRMGSPRIAYCGVQIGIAFVFTALSSTYVPTSPAPAAWRALGTLVGSLIAYVVFTQLWPVSAKNIVFKNLARSLRLLSELALVPVSGDDRLTMLRKAQSLRRALREVFASLDDYADQTEFEFIAGFSKEDVLRTKLEAQSLFLMELSAVESALEHSEREPPAALHAARVTFRTALAQTLDNLADGLEGLPQREWADLDAAYTAWDKTADELWQTQPDQMTGSSLRFRHLRVLQTINQLKRLRLEGEAQRTR